MQESQKSTYYKKFSTFHATDMEVERSRFLGLCHVILALSRLLIEIYDQDCNNQNFVEFSLLLLCNISINKKLYCTSFLKVASKFRNSRVSQRIGNISRIRLLDGKKIYRTLREYMHITFNLYTSIIVQKKQFWN